jgi:hypothetical protein
LRREGLLHSLALLPVDGLTLLVGQGHTLLPEQKAKRLVKIFRTNKMLIDNRVGVKRKSNYHLI